MRRAENNENVLWYLNGFSSYPFSPDLERIYLIFESLNMVGD